MGPQPVCRQAPARRDAGSRHAEDDFRDADLASLAAVAKRLSRVSGDERVGEEAGRHDCVR